MRRLFVLTIAVVAAGGAAAFIAQPSELSDDAAAAIAQGVLPSRYSKATRGNINVVMRSMTEPAAVGV